MVVVRLKGIRALVIKVRDRYYIKRHSHGSILFTNDHDQTTTILSLYSLRLPSALLYTNNTLYNDLYNVRKRLISSLCYR